MHHSAFARRCGQLRSFAVKFQLTVEKTVKKCRRLITTDCYSVDKIFVRGEARQFILKVGSFTGKENLLVRSTALNAGASAFFMKPSDDEKFIAAVRAALNKG